MMKNMKAATPEYATSETFVWWDMDTSPVPNGYDPKRLAPRIDTALKELGYNGPLTIIGVGNLEGVPHDFLEALSSTGVVIKHAPWGSSHILEDLLDCKSLDQAPVTIMLIAGDSVLMEAITSSLCERDGGYNFLLAYPPSSEPEDPLPSSLVVCGEWLWDRVSLLKDSGSAEVTRGLVMGGETFECGTCFSKFPSFEDFTTHLKSSLHARKIEVEYKDMERDFDFSLKEEAEAKAKKLEIATAKAKKQSEAKKMKKEAEDQMRMFPRRSKRLPQEGRKSETEEKTPTTVSKKQSKAKNNVRKFEIEEKTPTTMSKKQSQAKKMKIRGEYMSLAF
uniref:C2H2-type domain-containing protein n=1 Tax=Noccaea caerulescens TaxID=107243 RepID=A0A1J3E0S9_NOCCA